MENRATLNRATLNRATLIGDIRYLKQTFTLGSVKFYEGVIQVKRTSGTIDNIPIVLDEHLVQQIDDMEMTSLKKVIGIFRSKNITDDGKNKLKLYIQVTQVCEILEQNVNLNENNLIEFIGYLCKKPTYRKTPSKTQICDLLIANNQPNKKSNYLPCICWNGLAYKMSFSQVGDCFKINGRLQSREYIKIIDGKEITKTAYELSIQTLEVLNEEK